jgi:molybdopterin-containing oxidoreductase family iron-sulfur binding subunit
MTERPAAPRYWRSLEEWAETPAARRAAHEEFLPGAVAPPELPREPSGGLSRRHFLGLVGALAAAAGTGCDWAQNRPGVVAYTRRPREVVPGVATYYASTFPEGRRGYAVLVKTREGRPIHIAGNDEHPGLQGRTPPRAVADLLGLYDPDRLRSPRRLGMAVPWPAAEQDLADALAAARDRGRRVLLLAGASASPTRARLLAQLRAAVPHLEVLLWDPAEGEGAQAGTRAAFGLPMEIRPRIGAARVVLCLGADPLNGEDPEAIRGFAAGRKRFEPEAPMSRLWVVEGPMSATGARADHRFPVRPSLIPALAFALARDLHLRHGLPLPGGIDLPAGLEALPARAGLGGEAWTALLADLRAAGPQALVLCGDGLPAEAHVATHLLNAMLGGWAQDRRPAEPLATQGDLWQALVRMAVGDYHAVVLWGVDPARTCRDPSAWASHFAKVPVRVWIGQVEDASAAQCQLLLPEHHWLEAWGDHRDRDWLTLQQPAVAPLYDTRQGEDLWLGQLRRLGVPVPAGYRDYLEARWLKEVRPAAGGPMTGDRFRQALHDGLVALPPDPGPVPAFRPGAAAPAAAAALAAAAPGGLELVLRPGTQVRDGRYANNPWLQELPDPVSKTTWGNPLSVSVADAGRLGLRDGDLAELGVDGATLVLPVVVQPGQAAGVLALALGYGGAGSVARGVGVNAFPLLAAGSAPNLRRAVRLAKGDGRVELPLTQHHHRMEGRDLVRSLTPAGHAEAARRPRAEVERPTLYGPTPPAGPRWGMVIDLAACVGCSACVLACQSENNVPTVGPEQVARGREMHWLRIDRYYEGDPGRPERVLRQPMLCQHCEHAPCENVCPVNATNHSPDGLNQMVYNRCVGTRYCANNCPYKVRRFNFLEFNAGKREPESLAFNPEVTVRPRGVMEKCTFCVQRIQDGRMRAMAHGRDVQDGEITPACAAACPGDAMVFGDLNDPRSRVARLAANPRGYQVLDELGTRPAITYLADLYNPALPEGPDPARPEAPHGA